MKIDVDVTETKNIDISIKLLQILKKVSQKHVILSTKGISNKIKYYLLGYIMLKDYEES